MIQLRGLQKTFRTPAGSFDALRGVDLDIAKGELVTVVGRSGSGKTTLLNLMAGIDRATAGEVTIGGERLGGMKPDRLARWRGKTVGVVFQFFQLLPTLTVAENVMLPMDLCNVRPPKERKARALDLLAQVDLADQAAKLPAQLSGGQQQRVAIARALANDPPVLLADEPTGNLDVSTGASILALFAGLAAAGKSVVIVTHERDSIPGARRTVTLFEGAIAP
jgi:putative ABC transport system ATP-binding protein